MQKEATFKNYPIMQIIRQNDDVIVIRFSQHNEWHKDQVFRKNETIEALLDAYITITGDEPFDNRKDGNRSSH